MCDLREVGDFVSAASLRSSSKVISTLRGFSFGGFSRLGLVFSVCAIVCLHIGIVYSAVVVSPFDIDLGAVGFIKSGVDNSHPEKQRGSAICEVVEGSLIHNSNSKPYHYPLGSIFTSQELLKLLQPIKLVIRGLLVAVFVILCIAGVGVSISSGMYHDGYKAIAVFIMGWGIIVIGGFCFYLAAIRFL
jgi:hypothetical protein